MNRRQFLYTASLASLSACNTESEPSGAFQPNWESIRTHEVPDWFKDAKFGMFVHWGLYSVPAWATPLGELGEIDFDVWFRSNPYAEWYLNSLRIKGSPTEQHHVETYGADFSYRDFTPMFDEAAKAWDPAKMAELFADVGARYVVLTTKHHDGFTLWPSEIENPHLPPEQRASSRDIVGELTDAVRARNMEMGLYYSGGLDWSFNPQPIEQIDDLAATVIHTQEYADYADAHWRELIEKYNPSVLWNDIAYPRPGDLEHIFSDYYNANEKGLVNNRFETRDDGDAPRHHDFETPEYAKMDAVTDYAWETCRGLGFSFGYNQIETEEHTIGEAELIHLLADIVSKNGNLLLNVGPRPDGSIPELQEARLRALGSWLNVNGEAIYGTRPWTRADAKTDAGLDVRFTQTDDALYAVLFGNPNEAAFDAGQVPTDAKITLLGSDNEVTHEIGDAGLHVTLPEVRPETHAAVLKIVS